MCRSVIFADLECQWVQLSAVPPPPLSTALSLHSFILHEALSKTSSHVLMLCMHALPHCRNAE